MSMLVEKITMRQTVNLSNKVGLFGECITRKMSIRAAEHSALNLAQGFPTEDPPADMMEAAIASIKGHRNFYADMRGDPRLRQAIAEYTTRFNSLDVNGNENVTVTCGTTEAMIATLLAIVNSGDEVILFEPWYENYFPQIILVGAQAKLFTLEPPAYQIDVDKLRTLFSNKTKAIIINTPNNPTGRCFTREELKAISDLCLEFGCYVIVDEIYQHITFDHNRHISLAGLDGMKDLAIVVNGMSKAFAATGWRVGWAIANPDLTLAIRRVHDFLTGTVPTPFQDGSIAGLALPDSYFSGLKKTYTQRRELLGNALIDANIDFFMPEGTYYILADISRFGFKSSEEFAQALLAEAGVAVVPGTAFYTHNKWREQMVRLTFSKDDETISRAGARLVQWSHDRRNVTKANS
jgi:aspartate/methionine/tyrosine aminotransferase